MSYTLSSMSYMGNVLAMTTTFRLREVMDSLSPVPSLRAVALGAELDYTTVHSIYHNKAARVSLATLDALATVLGCASGDLLAGPGGKRSTGRTPR
jgi:hypothetical protein